jgi:hypothetical protein
MTIFESVGYNVNRSHCLLLRTSSQGVACHEPRNLVVTRRIVPLALSVAVAELLAAAARC